MINVDNLDRYRPNVGILLFNRTGGLWLGRRVVDDAEDENLGLDDWRWQAPQGGVDPGESWREAAFRELKEETGVVSARLLTLTPGWLAYRFPSDYQKKDWIGQRQKWAAMLFEGDDSEIDLEADDHQEFDAWRWAELEDAPTLIVPFKREIYRELVDAFTPLRDYLRATAG